MRLSSLDELPQFWNVLRGDMALVGPRPIVDEELEHYNVRERRLLLSVRPGITGAWAVGGRSRIGYPDRAQIELDYVRGWSLGRDVGILLRTAGAVLGRRGAS
jgi:lipopolysaccharide/colanic/teichoic acid biosynthesis glycosyltransferase